MWKSRYDYCIQDKLGRWINTEFPPEDLDKYTPTNGYENVKHEFLFLTFAFQYYDMAICYKGIKYLLFADESGCAVLNECHEEVSEYYPTANDLIKQFRFCDGKGLLDVLDSDEFDIDVY